MGTYRGKAVDDESVKKRVNFQGLLIHIDRPKGFKQTGKDAEGKPWERTYKFDYGFIPKTLGGDDDGLDVFIGPNADAEEAYWVRQVRDDGSFDEYKIFVGFPSRAAATAAFKDHIPAKYLGGMVPLSLDMMKAMLGVKPDGGTKLATLVSLRWGLEYS